MTEINVQNRCAKSTLVPRVLWLETKTFKYHLPFYFNLLLRGIKAVLLAQKCSTEKTHKKSTCSVIYN